MENILHALVGFVGLIIGSFVVTALLTAAANGHYGISYWHAWELVAGLMLFVYAIGFGIVLARSHAKA